MRSIFIDETKDEDECEVFIKKYYEPVDDKPGYVWLNRRNMTMISIDNLIASCKPFNKESEDDIYDSGF